MSTDKTNDNDLDLEEFDSFIRSTLLTEGNKLRAEKGCVRQVKMLAKGPQKG